MVAIGYVYALLISVFLVFEDASCKEGGLVVKVNTLESQTSRNPLKMLDDKYLFIDNSSNGTYITNFDFTWQELLSTKVCIGTPEQCIEVILDTGSSMLWVASEKCTEGKCPSKKYYSRDSSTSSNSSQIFNINYVTGNIQGNLFTDLVSINRLGTPVYINFINAWKANFGVSGSYGILGLGRNYNISSKYTDLGGSIIKNLVSSSQANLNVFSFKWISKAEGEFVIGDYPSELKDTNFQNYTSCKIEATHWGEYELRDAFWSCNAKAITINNQVVRNTSYTSLIFDTGSNMLMAPYDDAQMVLDIFLAKYKSECALLRFNMDGSSSTRYLIACTEIISVEELPEFGFQVGNGIINMNPKYIMVKSVSVYQGKIYNYAMKIIFGYDIKNWLIGVPFLKNYLTVFDKEKMEVGFKRNYVDLSVPSSYNQWLITILIFAAACVAIGIILTFTCWRKSSQVVGAYNRI